MAVPEGVTAVYDNVIVFVYGGGGFGIRVPAGIKNAAVGTIYKIGANAYRVSVGQRVGFKTDVFFATDVSDDAFAVVPQDNIMITYEPPIL